MVAGHAEDLQLSATRVLPSPPGLVWAGLTTRSQLQAWWSPEEMQTTVRRLEPHAGGAVELRIRYLPALLTPDAARSFRAAGVPISLVLRGRLGKVIPERVIEFDLKLDAGAGATFPMLTRFELEPGPGSTKVTILASGVDTPHWRSLGQQNLAAQLARLERAVSAAHTAR